MTLAFSSLGQASVSILTDAAVYDRSGTLTDLRSKVHVSPHVPLTVTPIGFSDGGNQLARAIIRVTGCGSFDTTIALAGRVIASLSVLDIPEEAHFAVIISGVSETRGPCHYIGFTRSPEPDVFPAFTLCDPGAAQIGNGVLLDSADLAATGITESAWCAAGDAALVQFAVPLAGAMRMKPSTNFMAPDQPPAYIVGGWLELTTITSTGVHQQRLVTWPDEIGRAIDPTALPVKPAAAA